MSSYCPRLRPPSTSNFFCSSSVFRKSESIVKVIRIVELPPLLSTGQKNNSVCSMQHAVSCKKNKPHSFISTVGLFTSRPSASGNENTANLDKPCHLYASRILSNMIYLLPWYTIHNYNKRLPSCLPTSKLNISTILYHNYSYLWNNIIGVRLFIIAKYTKGDHFTHHYARGFIVEVSIKLQMYFLYKLIQLKCHHRL